jgi:GntR family transcriptional regulator / MocR family aminotransferase
LKRIAGTFIPPISVDRGAVTAMHRQIFDWFQSAIAEGRLLPGSRVPSSRGLAAELGTSRIPVVNAYEQLHAEGYVETVAGVGTRVAKSIPSRPFPPRKGVRIGASTRFVSASIPRKLSTRGVSWSTAPSQPWLTAPGGFRVSLPALDHFPLNVWSKLVARQTKSVTPAMLAYGDAAGYKPLREAIADYVSAARGVRCVASQILITTGSQQGLQIASQVLLNPKDQVCMEDPGYPGARQAFAMADAEMVPIKLDTEGISVSELIRLGRDARAVYVTPSHQYPMGMSMSAARRLELLDWASRNGTWIIEDDYDSEYRYDSRPIAALQGLDANARVLYMGTFSKVMFPSLRLGYLVLPVDLLEACKAARDAMDIFSPVINQAVMAEFIREGHFGRHLRRMRMLYMEKRQALVTALQSRLHGSVEIVGAEAGLHLVVLLHSGVNDQALAGEAALKGLSVMPLSSCRIVPETRGGLVLGYGGLDARRAAEGVRKLQACLRDVESRGDDGHTVPKRAVKRS